jgi:hypothetical protein
MKGIWIKNSCLDFKHQPFSFDKFRNDLGTISRKTHRSQVNRWDPIKSPLFPLFQGGKLSPPLFAKGRQRGFDCMILMSNIEQGILNNKDSIQIPFKNQIGFQ